MRLIWMLPVLFGFTFASATHEAAVEPRGFSLQKPLDVTVVLFKTERIRLRVHDRKLEVTGKNLKGSFALDDVPEPSATGSGVSWIVLVDDFNFDGFTDLAIPTGDGYGGVNYFYDLYAYQPAQRRFQRLEIKNDPSGDFLCNPRLEVFTRTIWTDCKSGPKWFGSDYRFLHGKPYLWRSAEMMLLDSFPEDSFLYYALEYRNAAGGVTREAMGETPHAEDPVIRYLPIPKAYLYTAPANASRTNNYIIRNDAMRILEVRESDAGQWLKIAYQSQKLGRIVRWINLGL
jgi:hypothetical protein